MDNDRRREIYLRDRSVLTPAQRRSLKHHERPPQQLSRLRKRFERKELRRIKSNAAAAVAFIRGRKSGQIRKARTS